MKQQKGSLWQSWKRRNLNYKTSSKVPKKVHKGDVEDDMIYINVRERDD